MDHADRIAKYERAFDFSQSQVRALTETHPDVFPAYSRDGRWAHSGELWTDWCGGFLAGMALIIVFKRSDVLLWGKRRYRNQ